MRISLLLFAVLYIAWPCRGQIPDDPETGTQTAPRAQPADVPLSGPAAAQDAEASREKLLKAADQLDMIEGNSETTKVAVDGMKTDIAQLQTDNTNLKQQIADLKTTIAKMEADRVKERQVLVDEVAQLVAASKGTPAKPTKKHHEDLAATTTQSPNTDPSAGQAPPDARHGAEDSSGDTTASGDLSPPADPAPAPKPQKGYYHTVESGETLTMICAAYRDQGVKVSVSQVRKANGLSIDSVLRVGQKLFIPKPGA